MEAAKFSAEHAKQFIEKAFDESALPSLMEYIAIPNLSRLYSADWQTNGYAEKAVEHIKKWVDGQELKGAKVEIIKDEGYSPLLFIEVEG